MRKKQMKEKGVTLIALVITIIILLILAGITISALTGENGLFKRAVDARENTLIAGQEENVTLKGYEQSINDVLSGSSTGRRFFNTTSMGGKCRCCGGWSTNTKRIYSRPR